MFKRFGRWNWSKFEKFGNDFQIIIFIRDSENTFLKKVGWWFCVNYWIIQRLFKRSDAFRTFWIWTVYFENFGEKCSIVHEIWKYSNNVILEMLVKWNHATRTVPLDASILFAWAENADLDKLNLELLEIMLHFSFNLTWNEISTSELNWIIFDLD